jgi:hypothetical protein
MTDTTPNLGLPQLAAAQAQKHVTHNEALRALDALVQLTVLDRDLAAPPASPSEGERFIVAAGASGDWAGHTGDIAAWQDNGWQFYAPQTGWLAYVADEGRLVGWNGSAWADALSALDNLGRLGVGTAADAINPFSARLNNALWAARTVAEGGDGNLRYKMSKESAAGTLSLLMQTDFSGRAEIGLTGDDDLHVKVSVDGSAWTDALVVDRTTGITKVQGLADAATGVPMSSLVFTPGGEGVTSIYRIDASSAQNPRTATISAIAADIVTLTAAVAETIFKNGSMTGVSYVRIWNTSKAPNQPAWVKAQPGADQLQVLDAAAIAGWANGETIQLGDPTGVTPNRVIAFDISPMMQNVLGAVFLQKGIMVKAGILTTTAGDKIDISGSGVSGSFVNAAQAQTGTSAQALGDGVTIIPCTVPSPVSNSNLVFMREIIATTATVRLVSSMGLFK